MSDEFDDFDLIDYEMDVANGRHNKAFEQLMVLLNQLQKSRNNLNVPDSCFLVKERKFMAWVAGATASLLLDTGWEISDQQYLLLVVRYESLAMIFASSDYESTDHLMQLISRIGYQPEQKMKRWYLCISLSSPQEMYQILLAEKVLAFPKVIALLGQSCVLTKEEEDNKAFLIENLEALFEGMVFLSDELLYAGIKTWMECSYIVSDKRHLVKLYINQVIKRTLAIEEVEPTTVVRSGRKSLGVVVEVMRQNHAMYRCYRNLMATLKDEFDVTIYAEEKSIDETVKAFGHKVVAVNAEKDTLNEIADLIREGRHDMLYYPSLGMAWWTVAICNYRLAPVQGMTFGHPATSCSDAIDFGFVDPEAVPDPNCHTEKLIEANNGMTSIARHSKLESFTKSDTSQDGFFHIAITSTFIKLNWLILYVCSELVKQSKKPLYFHFFVAGSGRVSSYISRSIKKWLDNYTVYEEMPYTEYLSNLSKCSMRLGTMPFGGTNTTIDCITLGISSVVYDGPELFSHVEPILLRRLQNEGEDWIDQVICSDISEYIEVALEFIGDDKLREKHSAQLVSAFDESPVISENARKAGGIYSGTFQWLLDNLDTVKNNPEKIIRSGCK